MPTMIKYADILNYLDAIMARDNDPIEDAPHGVWWRNPNTSAGTPLSYSDFVNGSVPGIGVPIIDKSDPANSSFYVILTNESGFQGMPQMPLDGPYITDSGYTANLPGGGTLTGQEIQANMLSWLTNGYPES
jgi:hypothetical protein